MTIAIFFCTVQFSDAICNRGTRPESSLDGRSGGSGNLGILNTAAWHQRIKTVIGLAVSGLLRLEWLLYSPLLLPGRRASRSGRSQRSRSSHLGQGRDDDGRLQPGVETEDSRAADLAHSVQRTRWTSIQPKQRPDEVISRGEQASFSRLRSYYLNQFCFPAENPQFRAQVSAVLLQ